MQSVELYRDVVAKIEQLQLSVNNLLASNTQSGQALGANLISSTDINALNAAMTTLQADRVTLRNTNPAVVAGN
jgi:hypothetical protein